MFSVGAAKAAPKLVIEQTREMIGFLEQQIKVHRDAGLKLMQQYSELQEAFQLIISINGLLRQMPFNYWLN